MKKQSRNLRVTLSSQYYGNHAYCPPKRNANVATEKQINYFDWLLNVAKENGLVSDEKEQEFKRLARTRAGFSRGISTLKTFLMKANISLSTGEPIPEDSPFHVKSYNLYKVDDRADGERKEQNDG